MKLNKILIALVSYFIAAACGMAETHTFEVGQFEKLKINGSISVVYKNLPDSTGFARYEAPEENKDMFIFSTKGEGTLKVEPGDEKWGETDLPVINLYSDFLTSIDSYSDREVQIVSLAPCASFNVTQIGNGTISVDDIRCNNLTAAIATGNGSIYLSGQCINANFRMVGAGLISADRLKSENVKCRILGTGSIGCAPVETLKVTGLGSTKIYYKGSPKIKKTGGGKLYELPADDGEAFTNFPSATPVESFSSPGSEKTTVSETENDDEDDVDDSEEDDDEDDEEEDEEEDDDDQTVVTADD